MRRLSPLFSRLIALVLTAASLTTGPEGRNRNS